MIEVQQKGTEVILKVDVNQLGYYFSFSYDARQEWAAKALCQILNKALKDRIYSIREKEYKAGIKDARKKASERKDWFSSKLDL